MKIAIDLDNTLLDYSSVIPLVIQDLKLPSAIESKQKLKEYLESNDKDWPTLWIQAQGLLYGKYISHAKLFPDSLESINFFIEQGHDIEIISHKSKISYCKNFPLQELALKKFTEEINNKMKQREELQSIQHQFQ